MASDPIKLICEPDLVSVERRARRRENGIRDRGGDYVRDHVELGGKLYKYLVIEPYFFPLNGAPIKRDLEVSLAGRYDDRHTRLFALLSRDGLWVYEGYRWDGASGPTIDTEDSMQGSLFHDVIYQMMREGELPADVIRPRYLIRAWADWQFRRILKEDGMPRARRSLWFRMVRKYAAYAAEPTRVA